MSIGERNYRQKKKNYLSGPTAGIVHDMFAGEAGESEGGEEETTGQYFYCYFYWYYYHSG